MLKKALHPRNLSIQSLPRRSLPTTTKLPMESREHNARTCLVTREATLMAIPSILVVFPLTHPGSEIEFKAATAVTGLLEPLLVNRFFLGHGL